MHRCSVSGAVVPLSAIAPRTSSPPAPFLASSLAFPPTRIAGSFTAHLAPCPALLGCHVQRVGSLLPSLPLPHCPSPPPAALPRPLVDPLPPQGSAPLGVSQVDPLPLVEPVEVTGDSSAARGAASRGAEPAVAEPGGAEPVSAEPRGAEPERAEFGGAEPAGLEPGGAASELAEPGGAEPVGAEPGGVESRGAELRGPVSTLREPLSPQQLREWFTRRTHLWSGAAGAGVPGAASLELREWYAWHTRLRNRAGGAGGPTAGGAGAGGTGAAGAGGAGGAGTAGPGGARAGGAGAARAGGAAGAGGAGPGGARTGGTGAAGAGGGAAARGAGGAGGAGPRGARTRGTGATRAGGGAAAGGAGATGLGGARTEDTRAAGACGATGAGGTGAAGAGGAACAGGARGASGAGAAGPPPPLCPPPDQSQPQPASRPASLVCAVRTGRRVPPPRPPPVPGTHGMALRPSSVPLRVLLPSPPASSVPDVPDPESHLVRAASPSVTGFLAIVVIDPSFKSTAASALVAELVDFAATCPLDYAASLVAKSKSVCPLSVRAECALGTDILEDRQPEFECLAAAVPHLVSMLLAPEGDLDPLDIPTPRSYAEAITCPYSSQWQTAMDAEMAS
ncbi:unnamed protein product [Closterium sp. NIES-64]|nr:unnamed protein product [Closterium sp. NIES-64]